MFFRLSHDDLAAADAELLSRVNAALVLRGNPALRKLHTTVRDGVVLLQGRVATFYDRQLAVSSARSVPGVTLVRDEMEVELLPYRPGSLDAGPATIDVPTSR